MSNSEFSVVGRDLSPVTTLILTATVALGGFSGLVMALTSFTPFHAWPWVSDSYLTPLMMGLALLGVSPAIISAAKVEQWENARILVSSVVIIVIGLALVTIIGPFILHTSKSTGIVTGIWLLGVLALSLGMIAMLAAQFRELRLDMAYGAPFPRWSVPLVALLGASHFGLGLGLIGAPDFWGALVPWKVNGTDANALGVWCLGLGVGLLFALAENDVLRARTGSLAMLGVGAAEIVAYALGAGQVHWLSWPAMAGIGLAFWLFFTGVVGLVLARFADPIEIETVVVEIS